MYRLSNPANSILPSAMPSDPNSPRSKALRLISNSRFHRTFTLPATPDHDELTITYADAGHDPEHPDDRDSTTILFMPGMFSSRYHGIPVHVVAEKLDVRVLVIDRYGLLLPLLDTTPCIPDNRQYIAFRAIACNFSKRYLPSLLTSFILQTRNGQLD